MSGLFFFGCSSKKRPLSKPQQGTWMSLLTTAAVSTCKYFAIPSLCIHNKFILHAGTFVIHVNDSSRMWELNRDRERTKRLVISCHRHHLAAIFKGLFKFRVVMKLQALRRLHGQSFQFLMLFHCQAKHQNGHGIKDDWGDGDKKPYVVVRVRPAECQGD